MNDRVRICARCDAANRPRRKKCWVCEASLQPPGTDSREPTAAPSLAGFGWLIGITVLLFVLPYLLKVAFAMLVFVTCFGLAAAGSLTSDGRSVADGSVENSIGLILCFAFAACFFVALFWPSRHK
jgi:hypothetical protein